MAQSNTGQGLLPLKVTLASAGTAQRIVTDSESTNRFVKSAYVRPKKTNVGSIFVGNSAVSSTLYSEVLVGSDNEALSIVGDQDQESVGSRFNYVDLYNTWVNGDNTGDIVFVTILPVST